MEHSHPATKLTYDDFVRFLQELELNPEPGTRNVERGLGNREPGAS